MPADFQLNDPIFAERLNPVFLNAIQKYWNLLLDAKDVEEKILLTTKSNLLRVLFLRFFKPLYLQFPPRVQGSVFFLSHILSDGIGDYFSLLKSARIIKREHTALDVHLAYVFHTKLPDIIPADYFLTPDNIHAFPEKPKQSILETILEGKSAISFNEEIREWEMNKAALEKDIEAIFSRHGERVNALEELINEASQQISALKSNEKLKLEAENLYLQMQKSLALVHIATALNTFENPLLAAKSFYFAEAGNFQGIGSALQLNWFSMGLQPFEEGLFLKEPFAVTSRWQDEKLPRLLWNNIEPDPGEIEDYFTRHSLHLGYLSKVPKQQQIFIHVVCLQQKNDPRHIDIILSKFQAHAPSLSPDWLAEQGIGKVVLVNPWKNEEEVFLETDAKSNKTLRLIYSLPVPTNDFKRLLSLSGDLVGCTGDGSLSDCLTLEKIPFYELRTHKMTAWKSLQDLTHILNLPDLHLFSGELMNFQNFDAETSAERIHQLIRKEEFKKQWKDFIQFIKRYYCFEDALLAILNRHFYFLESPWLRENEELIIQKYLHQSISAAEAYDNFNRVLLNSCKK